MANVIRTTIPVVLAAVVAGQAGAQQIPVRVVPIAEADQFGFFPSANFGMANVSIALSDSLLDPFHNPALGARIRRGLYFGAPTFFAVSNDAGSGQTYPFGGIARFGRTFVGGAVALQEIDPARPRQFFPFPTLALTSSFAPVALDVSGNETQANRHGYATVGHTLGRQVTVAASALWSDLRAMEGMDLLFNGSHNVRQWGDRSDVRVGMLTEWGGRSLEAVALRSHLDMRYDVGYAQLYWDPATRQQKLQTHNVLAADASRTLGLHLKYDMPVRDSTWRAGAILTFNEIREGKAAYYEFMGIPRDPSRTMAYNVGAGLSRRRGPTSFAVDAILEPIWRRATGVVDTTSLALFAPGVNQEDSYFKFRNVVLRGGIAHDIVMAGSENRLRLQFGAQMRNVNYRLEQHDHLRSVFRSRTNHWTEWTHAWGTNFLFERFQFGYQIRLLSGMGRLGVPPESGGDVVFADSPPFFPGNPPPVGTTLYPVRVASHQMFFSVPIR